LKIKTPSHHPLDEHDGKTERMKDTLISEAPQAPVTTPVTATPAPSPTPEPTPATGKEPARPHVPDGEIKSVSDAAGATADLKARPARGSELARAEFVSIGSAKSNAVADAKPEQIISEIRNGKWAKAVDAIRAELASGNKERADDLKKALPAVLWSGRFSKRANVGILEHSGLLCADVDKIGSKVGELHDTARNDPHVAAAFVSPSGNGLKIVFRVPADAAKHAASFAAVRRHVKQTYGVNVDEAAKDVARLCFVSHDPNAFWNPDAVPLDVTSQTPDGAEIGGRNNAAFNLACVCRDEGKTQREARSVVRDFAVKCNPPLSQREADACVKSAFSYSPILASKDDTEFELANRLAATLPPIKTCVKTWHAYEQGTWHKTERALFRPKAQAILPESIRTARREVSLLDHLEGRCQFDESDFAGFYKFGSGGEILINVANGVLSIQPDGKTKLLDHSPNYLFTFRVAAKFDPKAECPIFRRVLGELLPDADDRKLLQLFSGNILLPDCRFEVALVDYGEAGHGKSTVAEATANALGSDLVTRLTMSQICDAKGYHVPVLRHAAVNLGTELDAVELDESSAFKAIVSGEAIEARPIWGKPFTMRTVCKLMFLANSLPRFKYGTDAELRRCRFLRFDVLPVEKDVTLKTKLAAERDGIFLWTVEGLVELLTFAEMPIGGRASRAVLDRFRISNDPCGSFVTLRCQLSPDATTPKDELKNAFADFCRRNELPTSCGEWFLKKLYERWPQVHETRPTGEGGDRYYAVAGIALRK
jgi:P4 family phage/plasmid primase-like protien